MIELLNPTTNCLFGFAQRTKPALAALLMPVHFPHFFSGAESFVSLSFKIGLLAGGRHARHRQRELPPLNSKPSTRAYSVLKKRKNARHRYWRKCLNSCALAKRLALGLKAGSGLLKCILSPRIPILA